MKEAVQRFAYGQHEVTLETGRIARQASGAVLAAMGDTRVLATVVASQRASDRDFFPLTVDYEERTYSAGRIPGGFFKREGRPSEKAILTCRLIDRPIRPLFPDGFRNEVQVICTVMSVDPEIDPDIVAMLGASAALSISGVPFSGPVGSARVGYIDGDYVLNPDANQLAGSRLNLVVAGTENAVLMVESEAGELSEEQMLGAVVFGHEQMQAAIKAIRALADEAGYERWEWSAPEADQELNDKVISLAGSGVEEAYQVADKVDRQEALSKVRNSVVEALSPEDSAKEDMDAVNEAVKKLEKKIVRGQILAKQPRIDGRDLETVRPISIETGLFPRTHGSVLFTRGETQALVVTTLGTERDSQIIDAIEGERRDISCCTTTFRLIV